MKRIYVHFIVMMFSGVSFAVETNSTSMTVMPADSSPIEKIGHDAFMKAPGLSEAQKIKLSEIMKSAFAEAQKIKVAIANQKVDLFEAVTNPSIKNAEVNKIKKNIVTLDKKRLALMFSSLEEVQKIIGKNPETGLYLRNIMREKIQVDDHTK
jgi:hypothetical protein